MQKNTIADRLYQALLRGDRQESRSVVQEALEDAGTAELLVPRLFWPTYEKVENLYRDDEIGKLPHHCAIRLLRVLVDQNAARFHTGTPIGKTVLAFCGPSDADELGAQMAVDLLEAAGYETTFAGGGIASDEILARVQQDQPDFLLLFSNAASDLPDIRHLIDTLREIGACNNTRIIAGGGVFNRAEGLADEIGADSWAVDPLEVVELVTLEQEGISIARAPKPKKRRRSAA